jgi:hypothetical protein
VSLPDCTQACGGHGVVEGVGGTRGGRLTDGVGRLLQTALALEDLVRALAKQRLALGTARQVPLVVGSERGALTRKSGPVGGGGGGVRAGEMIRRTHERAYLAHVVNLVRMRGGGGLSGRASAQRVALLHRGSPGATAAARIRRQGGQRFGPWGDAVDGAADAAGELSSR